MNLLKLQQTGIFKKTTKKLHADILSSLKSEIKHIINDPKIGEAKKGDLKSIRVHKFKQGSTLYLLGYQLHSDSIILVFFGTHENYYRDLKKYLKS